MYTQILEMLESIEQVIGLLTTNGYIKAFETHALWGEEKESINCSGREFSRHYIPNFPKLNGKFISVSILGLINVESKNVSLQNKMFN